jgi:N-acetylglucosamine kinase-like BadF-type ATPase
LAETRRVAQRFRITHDAEPVLAAGAPQGWGVALIAGTGSLAYAVSPEGTSARAGGWGYLFGDEGSGYWIAIEGLRAAAHAADGRGPATKLLATFMEQLNVHEPLALIPAIHTWPSLSETRNRSASRRDSSTWAIASLAEVVFHAAEAGDETARALLDRAAEELAAMTAAAAHSAGMGDKPFPLAATGGVLLNGDRVFESVCERLRARGVAIAAATRVPHPVWGAVLLARREAR